MLKLNLPPTDLRVEKRGGRLCIWDHIRRRWIVLTPEEWVRQNFTHWMVEGLGYPTPSIGHEISLRLNGQQRRCDAVFYDNTGLPRIIMEFKAPGVSISQRTFDQICRYNIIMQVPLLIVSNGMEHYCVRVKEEKAEFLSEIPPFNMLDSVLKV